MATDEPLVLKVLRLRRPALEPPRLGTPPLFAGGFEAVEVPKLLLPMALVQSLVGEPFDGYLHLSNQGSGLVSNVTLRVEIKIDAESNSTCVLFNNASSPASIAPGDFIDATVDYALAVAGTYVLACFISYLPSGGTEQVSFRRSYRFPAMQPFAVVHRAVQLGPELLLECTVENVTKSDIYLASWKLDCVEGYHSSIVDAASVQGSAGDGGAVRSRMHRLRPQGGQTLVFRVSPADTSGDSVSRMRALERVGALLLGWHTPDGSSGCAEAHQIRLRPAATGAALDLRVASCPSRVRVEEPFELEVEVANRAARAAEPSLIFDTRLMGGVRVHGATSRAIGRIEPNASARLSVDLLIASPGLHGLTGIWLFDTVSNARSEFGTLCDVAAF